MVDQPSQRGPLPPESRNAQLKKACAALIVRICSQIGVMVALTMLLGLMSAIWLSGNELISGTIAGLGCVGEGFLAGRVVGLLLEERNFQKEACMTEDVKNILAPYRTDLPNWLRLQGKTRPDMNAAEAEWCGMMTLAGNEIEHLRALLGDPEWLRGRLRILDAGEEGLDL